MGTGPLTQQSSIAKQDKEDVLVERCRQGDKDSFAQLMRLYEKQVYNFTYRMLGNEEEAEDLTQDIFVSAFRGIRRFRGEAKFSTWLYRIALNQTRNRIKYLSKRKFFAKWSKRVDSEEYDGPENLADSGPSPEHWTLTKDLATHVQECLAKMPPQARQILILRDIQGFSYEELSDMLSLNPGTVKSRLHRARVTLQAYLAERLE
jgi:RNA polymerase sigma-70 factor (ECF subfamily)